MDEYVGLERDHPQSYHEYMWSNFFRHMDATTLRNELRLTRARAIA